MLKKRVIVCLLFPQLLEARAERAFDRFAVMVAVSFAWVAKESEPSRVTPSSLG